MRPTKIIPRVDACFSPPAGVLRNFRPSAVTPVPATTPATGTVPLVIFGKIIGGYLPTSGTFSSNDHRR
jgi:hypothetical protein